MRLKIMGLMAATALLAACESAPEGDATTAGQGGAAGGEQMAVAPGTQADFVANVTDRVFYGFDKSTLSDKDRETLKQQAEWLKKYPAVTITVQGHCDERGTTEYNLALGERRANAAKNYLMSLGIADSRIKVVSYGKERPIVSGQGEEVWRQNRVAITVID